MAKLKVAGFSLRTQVLVARAVAALVLISIVGTFVLFSGRFNAVSAAQLLSRSAEVQNAELNRFGDTVIHQRLSLKSSQTAAQVSFETWNDTVNGRIKTSIISNAGEALTSTANNKNTPAKQAKTDQLQDPTVSFLRTILRVNNMNEHRPLSADSYRSWSDSLSPKEETVIEGDGSLTIATSTDVEIQIGQIRSARFVVRDGDYHPFALQINVKTSDGSEIFDLTEEDYRLVSLSTLDPAIFREGTVSTAIPEFASSNKNSSREPLSQPTVEDELLTSNSNSSASATTADEVEVLDRLHRIGADVTEQISVTRTADGHLQVTGLVETEQRKSEVMRTLAPLVVNPALRIKIQTIDEATRALKQQKSQSQSDTIERVEVEKGTLAADTDLRAYFAGRGGETDEEIRRYASRVIGHSQSAAFQASALNRMANRFSSTQLAELKPEDRSKWLGILKGYASAVRRESGALRAQLQPVFGGFEVGGSESITSDADLIATARRLYELASTNDRLVRSAFTLSNGGSVSAIRSAQFRNNLAAAEALAGAIERTK